MALITRYARSKLSSIFKHPLTKNTISQSYNLSNYAKLSVLTCNNPNLLVSRTHIKVHYPSSNLELTHLRNYHNGGVIHYITCVSDYVVTKWGSWTWTEMVYYSMIGCVVCTWLVVCNWETVPYTNRKHYIPSSHICDPLLDAVYWHYVICDDNLKSHILDQNDPNSRRVFKITKGLLRALEKDLKLGDGSMTLTYFSGYKPITQEKYERVKNMSWLQRRRERKAGIYHLYGMHWEVMVIDSSIEVACCLPNGKIIVTTHFLNKCCETDHDIATVVGHEMGHVIARHGVENLMIRPGTLTILLLCQLGILIPIIYWWILDWRKALIDYPISRSMEAEADRIGMMLMASAGYDPRKAPNFYSKHGADVPTHPKRKKRAEMLRKKSIMQEALGIYNKVISESKQHNQN